MNIQKNKIIFKDKTIYIGGIKNNKPHGKGTIYNPGILEEDIPYKSSWIKKGIFKNGDFVQGQIQESGKIVEGKFKNKKPIGNAKIIWRHFRSPITSEYFGQIKRIKLRNFRLGYYPYGKGKLISGGRIEVGDFKSGFLKKGKIFYSDIKKWSVWPPKE